jgi:hypothetical protein
MDETHYIRTADNVILKFSSIEVIKKWFSEGKLSPQDYYLLEGKHWVNLKDYLGSKGKSVSTTQKLPFISTVERQSIEKESIDASEVQQKSKSPEKESPPWAESEIQAEVRETEKPIPWKESDLKLPPVGRRKEEDNERRNPQWTQETDYEIELINKSRRPLKIFFLFIGFALLGIAAFFITLKIMEPEPVIETGDFPEADLQEEKTDTVIEPASVEKEIPEVSDSDFRETEEDEIKDEKEILSMDTPSVKDEMTADIIRQEVTSKKISSEEEKIETKKTEKKTAADEGKKEGGSYENIIAEGREMMNTDPSAAINLFLQASKKKPGMAEPLANIGDCYSRIGDSKQAIVFYNRALVNNKDHLASILGLARAYKKLGLSAQAKAKYQDYLKLSPDGKFAEEAKQNLK